MFEALDEIRRQLAAGEDARSGFKEAVFGDRGVRSPNAEDMAGEMVAFANAEGGVIFLGVDDGGVFDEQTVPTATVDDLDRESLDGFFKNGPVAIPWPDLLRNTRVSAVGGDGQDLPTVAGLLAFGRAPQEHLPSACIEAGVYRGTHLTSEHLVHAQRIAGRVDTQIDEATAFVDRFMLRPARKPVGREDHPQYDTGAAHEAIVNSVAHRDYSIAGSKIRLFLFDDRMEIYSPGALPNTLTIPAMPFRVFTRNQLLVSFLTKMKSRRTGRVFLESRGEGVRRILEVSHAHSGRRPVYELFGEELRLTIWAKPSPHEAREQVAWRPES